VHVESVKCDKYCRNLSVDGMGRLRVRFRVKPMARVRVDKIPSLILVNSHE